MGTLPNFKTCSQCGKQYRVYPSNKDTAKFCSRACKKLHCQNQAVITDCLFCSKPFSSRPRARRAMPKFCSFACAQQDRIRRMQGSQNWAWSGEDKACLHCGKTYHVPQKNLASSKYCSRACYWEYLKKEYSKPNPPYRGKLIKTCPTCGERWRAKNNRTTYCSKACATYSKEWRAKNREVCRYMRAVRLGLVAPPEPQSLRKTMPYKKWRQAVLRRDCRTCQECGRNSGIMHVHHILPFEDYPQFILVMNNGITMCKSCHESIKGQELDYVEKFFVVTGGVK